MEQSNSLVPLPLKRRPWNKDKLMGTVRAKSSNMKQCALHRRAVFHVNGTSPNHIGSHLASLMILFRLWRLRKRRIHRYGCASRRPSLR